MHIYYLNKKECELWKEKFIYYIRHVRWIYSIIKFNHEDYNNDIIFLLILFLLIKKL